VRQAAAEPVEHRSLEAHRFQIADIRRQAALADSEARRAREQHEVTPRHPRLQP
jgi:hypothetical protein